MLERQNDQCNIHPTICRPLPLKDPSSLRIARLKTIWE
ncbi:rCG46718 [Rattus norvegicus]|uniref:RCG46718 n=1 Tax=Rattus norvegicus TaxID=10116 RepID=A6IXM2_RAT|nr:rCG46718 [Rattus norvegicus]